jgi:Flp pilus assembly protein TadG
VRRRLGSDAGTAALEFALVIPIVLLVMLTALDFTRALLAYSTISNASREGVRYAVLHPTKGVRDIEEAVESRSRPLDKRALTVSVSYSEDGSQFASWPVAESRPPRRVVVRVEVSYPWQAASAVAGAFFAAATQSQGFVSTSLMEMRR